MRNAGIARQMMQYTFEILKSQGMRSVHILVRMGHTAALRSYAHLDFVKQKVKLAAKNADAGSADTIVKIMNGKLDPVMAFTLQKIKVEGDLGKALLLKQIIK